MLDKDQRKIVVKAIVSNALELAQDAFGNYVLQQIMDTAQPETLKQLSLRLKGSLSKLSVQKFSSIVVEKTIEMCVENREDIIKELTAPGKIKRLLQDPYANYVIQKILSVTRQEQFHEVVDSIRPHLANMGMTLFGKRIKTQMIRKFPILSMSTSMVKKIDSNNSNNKTPVKNRKNADPKIFSRSLVKKPTQSKQNEKKPAVKINTAGKEEAL